MHRTSLPAACTFTVVLAIIALVFHTAAASDSQQPRFSSSTDFPSWAGNGSYFNPRFDLPSSPDNWLGGTGNWSNGADWSAGEPGNSSDVFINTGNDYVTLDTSTNINSLTLGGASGSSTLIDPNSGNYTVNIAGALTINQAGTLTLTGDEMTANADSTNAGTVNLSLSFLSVNANFTNSGNIEFSRIGGIDVSGTLTNSGTIVDNSMSSNLTVGGDVNNSGGILMYAMTVNGDVTNQAGASLAVGRFSVDGNMMNAGTVMGYQRGSVLTIDGELTNSGTFDTEYAGVMVGSLNNSGYVDASGVLTVNGNAYNSGRIEAGFLDAMQSLYISGTLTNAPSGTFELAGPYVGATLGSLVNSGTVDLENASELEVIRNITSSGTVSVTGGDSGGSSLTVDGRFTNNAGGVFQLSGNSTATINNMVNVGNLSVGNGSTLTVPPGSHAAGTALAGFLNSGIVQIVSGGTISSPAQYTQTAGQTTVDGHLSGVVNFAGGSVYGNGGTISGDVTSNASFNIGDAPMTVGLLTIAGNYMQGPNGSITFDIASLNQYDQLNISGQARLNGLMTVDLLNGYIPQIGNMFDIMNFASESGTFSMVIGLPINGQEHFVLEYNSTNLTLDVVSGPGSGAVSTGSSSYRWEPFTTQTLAGLASPISGDSPSSVPEPGSILLLGSGTLTLGLSALRRRKRI